MLPVERLEKLEARYEQLSNQLSSGRFGEETSYAALAREHGLLAKTVLPYRRHKKLAAELQEARELAADESQDEEMRTLAREEEKRLSAESERLEAEIFKLLTTEDEDSDRPAIVEIRAGTGGEEAALFAADLLRMYTKYVENEGWKLELLDAFPTNLGGYKSVTFRVPTAGGFRRLKYEGGTHRVQRVPKTEAQGRIHTSAVTVAVLPQAEEVDVRLDESDLEITFVHSGGPGGQSVNTTDSAVSVLHKPTGERVKCQVHKSQHKNRALALQILRSRLLKRERAKAAKERGDNRRAQIGTGDRSGRIRTYNFPQNRVTDHRLDGNRNFSLDRIMNGNIGGLIDRLVEQATAARSDMTTGKHGAPEE